MMGSASAARLCVACGVALSKKQRRACSRECDLSSRRTPRACPVCAKPVPTRHTKQKYCSRRCYNAARTCKHGQVKAATCTLCHADYNARARARAQRRQSAAACAICREPLTVVQARENKRFCSRRCWLVERVAKRAAAPCRVCGNQPRHGRNAMCKPCTVEYERRREADRYLQKKLKAFEFIAKAYARNGNAQFPQELQRAIVEVGRWYITRGRYAKAESL